MRIMLDVAKNSSGDPVRIADVSSRQEITVKYTEQIMGILARNGLLRSVRGAQGGYVLTKKPSEYTAAQILRCTEGDLSCVDCEVSACHRADGCAMRAFWEGLNGAVSTYLEGVTLQDLLDADPNAADFYSI